MPDTRRIARNTLMLYFRQILIMAVSLYTVRVVLAVLGAEDYGIYNVVAGVTVMFTFVNNAMASGTQRFLNFYLGRDDTERVRETYSASLVIHAVIALVFVVLAETIGLWFVGSKLNIPEIRRGAAMAAYQLATVTSILSILSILRVPYNAVIIAYERMDFFAYISIIEAVLKLTVVFLLRLGSADRLVLYATLLAAVSAVILPGVTIGRKCIIGASAVVTKDIPDYTVAAGVPAKVIRTWDFRNHTWRKPDE